MIITILSESVSVPNAERNTILGWTIPTHSCGFVYGNNYTYKIAGSIRSTFHLRRQAEVLFYGKNSQFLPSRCLIYVSQMKYVSNEQGESFHFRPLPSLFHNSRQCSSSPFSYLKLFGSPAFQFVKLIGRPVDIQKNDPSSARSVPEVQKCSKPKPT